jgi:predicted RNA-binding Zn-ribbon protein involved in translation (DUF1610 family)
MSFLGEIYGEPTSQKQSWNAPEWYGESLHSSQVANARQLKYCESCGALGVRLQGSPAQFCPDCKPAMIARRRMQ